MDSIKNISPETIIDFIDNTDTFLLDCDGVLWRQKDIIPGVPETLKWLRSMGKRILFVTNNSTESRNGYKKKIDAFGIECTKDEIWGSSFIAASYLKSINFEKKAYVIGQSGIAEELEEAGISFRGVEEHAFFISNFSEVSSLPIDEEIGAIVVGMDTKVTYTKIAFALLHLQSNPGCLFIATNTDNTFPSSGTRILPGGGTVVKMLEYCSEMQPTIVGKPSQWFLDQLVKTYNLNRERTVMVGDKLTTDILFGNDGKVKTLLVYTGVTAPEQVLDATQNKENIYPTFDSPSLPFLMEAYLQAKKQ